jgi:hypothetical protein
MHVYICMYIYVYIYLSVKPARSLTCAICMVSGALRGPEPRASEGEHNEQGSGQPPAPTLGTSIDPITQQCT